MRNVIKAATREFNDENDWGGEAWDGWVLILGDECTF